jgi:hypothetical protein
VCGNDPRFRSRRTIGFVEAIAEDARLKYFADLRPDTYGAVDMNHGGRAEVAALAIQEWPTVSSNGESVLMYYILELDAQGNIVDDWSYPATIQQALAHLEEFPAAKWEELPLADGEGAKFIRNRLAQPPWR